MLLLPDTTVQTHQPASPLRVVGRVVYFLGLLYLRKTLHTGEPGLSKVLLSGGIVVSFLAILALSIYLGSRYL